MQRRKRSTIKVRAAAAYALTTYCGMGTKEACGYMKNITGTCLARLSDRGFRQFTDDEGLKELLIA